MKQYRRPEYEQYPTNSKGLAQAAKDRVTRNHDFPNEEYLEKIYEECIFSLFTISNQDPDKLKYQIGADEYEVNSKDIVEELVKFSSYTKQIFWMLEKYSDKIGDIHLVTEKIWGGMKELLSLYSVARSLDLPLDTIAEYELNIIKYCSGAFKNDSWGSKDAPDNQAVEKFLTFFGESLHKPNQNYKHFDPEIPENDTYLERYDVSIHGLIRSIESGDFEKDDFPVSKFSKCINHRIVDEEPGRPDNFALLFAAHYGDDRKKSVEKLVDNGAILSPLDHGSCKFPFYRHSKKHQKFEKIAKANGGYTLYDILRSTSTSREFDRAKDNYYMGERLLEALEKSVRPAPARRPAPTPTAVEANPVATTENALTQ